MEALAAKAASAGMTATIIGTALANPLRVPGQPSLDTDPAPAHPNYILGAQLQFPHEPPASTASSGVWHVNVNVREPRGITWASRWCSHGTWGPFAHL